MNSMDFNCVLSVNGFEGNFNDWSGEDYMLVDMVPSYSEEYAVRYGVGGYLESKYSARSLNQKYGLAA